jgi:large subunit ribosomal protein L33
LYPSKHTEENHNFITVTKNKMARKRKTILIKLISSARTGYFYTAEKNTQRVQRKLAFNKYDPIVRRHVLFTEAKIKGGSKK